MVCRLRSATKILKSPIQNPHLNARAFQSASLFPHYELMTPSILSHLPRQLSLGLTVSRHSDVYLPYSGLMVFLIDVYLPWSYGLSHNSFFGVWGYPFPGLFVQVLSFLWRHGQQDFSAWCTNWSGVGNNAEQRNRTSNQQGSRLSP